MTKFDNKELGRRVDEVLYYVWDPVGVSDEPCARREYYDYLPEILTTLERFDKPEPIAKKLAEIMSDKMGLRASTADCLDVADLLLRHKQAIKNGLA